MHKGSHIKKLPLSVKEQMRLLRKNKSVRVKVLLTLFLSKGIHPICLSKPRKYELDWNDTQVSWKRSKTRKLITSSWGKLIKHDLKALRGVIGLTKQRYWQIVKKAGEQAGIHNLCPLKLRYTYFCNRGRIGHHPYDISVSSGTSMSTVENYYIVGKEEMKGLNDEEITFLKDLIEP